MGTLKRDGSTANPCVTAASAAVTLERLCRPMSCVAQRPAATPPRNRSKLVPVASVAAGRGEPVRRYTKGVLTLERIPHDRHAGVLLHDAHDVLVRCVGDDQARVGQPTHELLEGPKVILECGIDVDVVVLDRGQHQHFCRVMQKLGGLFEKRSVILVPLDHKGAGAWARSKLRTCAGGGRKLRLSPCGTPPIK